MEFLNLKLEARQSRSELHWNRKLTASEQNPYPLAPKDMVGKISPEDYESENERFGLFCSSIMSAEVSSLVEPTFKNLVFPRIDVLGAGLGRDLGWMNQAMDLGCYVKVYDLSRVARERIEKNSDFSKHLGYHLEVVQSEIVSCWNDDEVLIYFASQFVQVQKRAKMQRLMRHFGSILKYSFLGFKPALYLVHPFGKDNLGVTWGDTTPYSEEEIMDAMTGKMGKSLMKVELLGVHSYFHQKYSLLKIQAKG